MKDNIRNILESVLFLSGDGLEKKDILKTLNISPKAFEKVLSDLKAEYSEKKGIHLIQYNEKIQFSTNPNYASRVSDILNPIREKALSKTMLEVLAIVAYKQPITRLEIENIRGVSSDYAIQNLLKHEMVEVVGRKDTLGKPMLFGTTDFFLRKFDLTSLDDLPSYDELLEKIDVIENIDKQNIYDTNRSSRNDLGEPVNNGENKSNEQVKDEDLENSEGKNVG